MNTQIITQANINIPEGKSLKLVDDTSKENKLSYIKLGNGRKNRSSKMESIDLLKEMETMTKAEIIVINILKDHLIWEVNAFTGKSECKGISYLPSTELGDKEKRIFRQGIKALVAKDLAKKISRNNYMINPLAIIPSLINEALKTWDRY